MKHLFILWGGFFLFFQPSHLLFSRQTDTTGVYQQLSEVITLADSGKLEDAIKKVEQIEPLYLASGDSVNLARTYITKAKVYLYQPDFSSATHALNQAKGYLTGDLKQKADWLFQKGVIFHETARYDSATQYFDNAEPLFLEVWGEKSAQTAEFYYFRGINQIRLGQNEAGLKLMDKVLELFKETSGDSSAGVGKTLNIIGYTHGEMGNLPVQIDYYQRSLAVNKAALGDSHPEVAVNYNNLAYTLSLKGDFQGAIEYLTMAKTINENAGKADLSLSGNYLNLGMNYAYIGDYKRGRYYMDKALEMRLRIYGRNHPSVANVYHNLGNVAKDLRKSGEALEYFENALEIRRNILGEGNPYVSVTYSLIGSSLLDMGKTEQALTYIVRGKEGLEAVLGRRHYMVAHAYYEYAYCLDQLGKLDEAQKAYRETVEVMTQTVGDANSLTARVYEAFAASLIRSGKNEEGLQVLQDGLIILSNSFNNRDYQTNPRVSQIKLDVVSVFLAGSKGVSLLEINTHDDLPLLNLAWETLVLTDSMIQKMRSGTWSGNSMDLYSWRFVEVYEKIVEAAQRIYAQTGDETILQQAFSLTEKAKAMTLYKAVRKNQAVISAGIPENLLKRERFLQSEISYYNKIIFEEQNPDNQTDSTKLLEAIQHLFQLTEDRNALLEQFENNYPEYYRLKFATGETQVTEVQQSLGEKEALISFYQGIHSLFAFFISRDHFQVHKVDIDSAWTTGFQAFISFLRDTELADQAAFSPENINFFKKNAHQYYTEFIAPFEERLNETEKLIIIPHRSLGYLPFDVLIRKAGEEEEGYVNLDFLLKHHRIRYAYSAALFMAPGVTHRQSRQLYAGFAPGDENMPGNIPLTASLRRDAPENFGSLFANQPEVSQTAQILNGESWLGQAATETAFREKIGRYKILHLATHAWLNDEDPLYSGLLFTPEIIPDTASRDSLLLSIEEKDGFLHAYEIYNLPIRADLAVLSACETGSGQVKGSEGVMSLARAFRYAGCPSIVMSLWKAEDNATRDLMVLFYENLKDGMGKDEALQKAKLKFLETSDKQHPHFWANFVLIGDDLPVTPDNPKWPLILLGVVLVLVILGFVFRKRLFSKEPLPYSNS